MKSIHKLHKNEIVLFTVYGMFNYGNKLQNYAVTRLLSRKGIVCRNLVLHEHPLYLNLRYILKIIMSYLPLEYSHHRKRTKNFILFHKRYIRDINCKKERLTDLDMLYSKFLVGSDQVWNPNHSKWDRDGTYLLSFVKKGIKISISASIGVSSLNEEQICEFRKYLDDFDLISVRECAARQLLEPCTSKDIIVLTDPTLALNKQEWLELNTNSKKAKKIINDGNYLLVYFLGEKAGDIQQSIALISKKYNLKIVEIGDPDNKDYYEFGPVEFVHLINHASLVITDSFHGVAFSINFETPFIVADRRDQMERMESRIDEILSKFNLESRRYRNIKDSELFCFSDYQFRDTLLDERLKFEEFINTLLKI